MKTKKVVILIIGLCSFVTRARQISAENPFEYFNWQNSKLYLNNATQNDSWDGRPVIVFIHGIRANTAMTWGVAPNVDIGSLSSGADAIAKLFLLSPGSNTCTQTEKFHAEQLANLNNIWAPIGQYYGGLCRSQNNVNRLDYLVDIQKALCRLRGIHTKCPGGFFKHNSYEYVKTVSYPCFLYSSGATCCEYGKICSKDQVRIQTKESTTIKETIPAKIDNNPEGAVIQGILDWTAKNYNRTNALATLNGIEFIDIADPRTSIDEYVRDPVAGMDIRCPTTTEANWELNTPYGWNGQVFLQTIEILEKYWPNGQWKGNNRAKIIFVCHSAGGLAIRNLVHLSADVSYRDDFFFDFRQTRIYNRSFKSIVLSPMDLDLRPNVGKIITFATPHGGGSGDFINSLNTYVKYIDKIDWIAMSVEPFSFTIKALFTTLMQILETINVLKTYNCDDNDNETGAYDVVADLAENSLNILRIRDEFPVNHMGQPIPVVCFEFAGDSWASKALLSRNLTPEHLAKYRNHLLEYQIVGLSGDNVHGESVWHYIDDVKFRTAFEFGGISPNTPPSGLSIRKSYSVSRSSQ